MRKQSVCLALCLSAVALVGCARMLYGSPSSARQADPTSATATSAATSSVKSAAASSSTQRDFQPALVDILSVFQNDIRSRPSDFDAEEIVAGKAVSTQLYLVVSEWKLHRHPNQQRVAYILSGRGEMVLDGTLEEVRAGHVIAIPAGTSLKLIPVGQQGVRLLVFATPGAASGNVEWLKEVDSPTEVPEEEVGTLEPIAVPDVVESSASSEVFQTGTLTTEPDSEVQ